MTTAIRTDTLLVVKLGGGAGLDMHRCIGDLAQIAWQRPLVVVHGVSAAANELAARRGVPVQTLASPGGHTSRYTDPAMREIYVEAAETVNRDLVEALRAEGVDVVPLTGVIEGRRKRVIRAVMNGRIRIVRDDYSGTITGVDTPRLLDIVQRGGVPVLPPLAQGGSDGFLNIDGDRAAAAVAVALGADDLVILSNVRGLYRDADDNTTFMRTVPAGQIEQAMEWARGRMKRKVLGAREALDGGVRRVIIGDGRADSPISSALSGEGTVFV